MRSIPMPATEGRPAIVVHVLPLMRLAYDIFSGSDVLVAVTEVARDAKGPNAGLLSGLFDLTAAEARLASALAAGKTLQQAADLQGIRIATARAYLSEVFHKTGTHQQSQLVALLKGTQAGSDARRRCALVDFLFSTWSATNTARVCMNSSSMPSLPASGTDW